MMSRRWTAPQQPSPTTATSDDRTERETSSCSSLANVTRLCERQEYITPLPTGWRTWAYSGTAHRSSCPLFALNHSAWRCAAGSSAFVNRSAAGLSSWRCQVACHTSRDCLVGWSCAAGSILVNGTATPAGRYCGRDPLPPPPPPPPPPPIVYSTVAYNRRVHEV